jgi:type VI secretion system protein VasI
VARITKTLLILMLATPFAMADSTDTPEAEADPRLTQALTCVNIAARLERLACFDQAFNTPVAQSIASNDWLLRPEAWNRAQDAEAARGNQPGFILHYQDPADPDAGIWLTATALTPTGMANRPRPILMLSCIDNISRVELVLPVATSAGKTRITVSAQQNVTQPWISDDTGTIVRTGRGLAAIAVMKSLLFSPRATLRSDVEPLDHLTFDTRNLAEVIKPMRKTCGW